MTRVAKLTRLSDVKPQPILWLLEERIGRRIPKGAVSIVAGPPGSGKTTFALAVAAELTKRGESVVFVGAEDGVQDTILPRLLAAGGDTSHFHALSIVENDMPDQPMLPMDTRLIEHALAETKATMLIVDPLGGHIGPEVNTHNDQSLRLALIPLAVMVRRRKVACVGIMHQNKGAKETSPLNSLNGGTAFGGVARSVLAFMRVAGDDPRARCLFHVKVNGARLAEPYVTRLTQADTGNPDVPEASVVDVSGAPSWREDDKIEWRMLS